MKYLVLFISLLMSQAFAANSIGIDTSADMTVVKGTNGATLVMEKSGDGKSETAGPLVYTPMSTAVGTLKTDDYYYGNTAGTTTIPLFGYNAVTTGAAATTFRSYNINFPVSLSVDSGTQYLYAAVKGATNYTVIQKYGAVTSGTTTVSLSPQTICEGVSTATNTCSNFDTNITPQEAIKTFNIYFFASSLNLIPSSTTTFNTTDANYTGGVFFQIKMSNQVYSAADLTVNLTDLKKGDGRLAGDFTTSGTVTSDFRYTLAFIHTSATTDGCSTAERNTNACSGTFVSDSVTNEQEGEFTLRGLTNSKPYRVSLALVDKYGFSSTLSNSINQTPTQIEELLKKQACYILTAGFGEEHYITNYFRSYRDHVLAHSWLGRKFIHLYYGTAPHYALIIYKSEKLRFMVRMFAYGLYFIFNYGWVVLIFFSSWFFLNFLRKNKILLQNNRL